jgi:hypothetical protein
MTLSAVHKYGLAGGGAVVATVCVVIAWSPSVGRWLFGPAVCGSFAAVDLVRLWFTRSWPRVELHQTAVSDRSRIVLGRSASLITMYTQSVSYFYDGRHWGTEVGWNSAPPPRSIGRVNHAEPTEVFCAEALGRRWQASLAASGAFIIMELFLSHFALSRVWALVVFLSAWGLFFMALRPLWSYDSIYKSSGEARRVLRRTWFAVDGARRRKRRG